MKLAYCFSEGFCSGGGDTEEIGDADIEDSGIDEQESSLLLNSAWSCSRAVIPSTEGALLRYLERATVEPWKELEYEGLLDSEV